MKLSLLVPAVLISCLAASASAESHQPLPPETVHYSHAELKQLKHDAQTPQQYQILAEYYKHQKQSFQEQADQEKREWDRRSQNVVGSAEKYPRPVDSARNVYQYYAYEADQADTFASKYEQLAHSAEVATSSTHPNH